MKISYDTEDDAFAIIFAETTVTPKRLADEIAASYVAARWKSWSFVVASAARAPSGASSRKDA
jgi:hypothetical protein